MADAQAAEPTDTTTTKPSWRISRGAKLDDTSAQALLDAITCGATLTDAAAHAGVSRQTVWRWMEHGADEAEPERAAGTSDREWSNQLAHWQNCRDLRNAVEKAEADARMAALNRILAAGREGTWQADAWFLERRYPNDYSRRVVEHQGPGGGPQTHVVEAGPTLGDLMRDPGRVLIGQELVLGGGMSADQLQAITDSLAGAIARSAQVIQAAKVGDA
jgi:hypothetical protein